MDTPAAPDPNLNARVAVLEEIAAATKAGLADIRAEMRSLRSEMTAGFDTLRVELRDELREMRSETASGFDTVRSEQRSLRLETAAEMRDLRAMHRWLLGIMLGGFVAMLGAIGGLLATMAHGFGWL